MQTASQQQFQNIGQTSNLATLTTILGPREALLTYRTQRLLSMLSEWSARLWTASRLNRLCEPN